MYSLDDDVHEWNDAKWRLDGRYRSQRYQKMQVSFCICNVDVPLPKKVPSSIQIDIYLMQNVCKSLRNMLWKSKWFKRLQSSSSGWKSGIVRIWFKILVESGLLIRLELYHGQTYICQILVRWSWISFKIVSWLELDVLILVQLGFDLFWESEYNQDLQLTKPMMIVTMQWWKQDDVKWHRTSASTTLVLVAVAGNEINASWRGSVENWILKTTSEKMGLGRWRWRLGKLDFVFEIIYVFSFTFPLFPFIFPFFSFLKLQTNSF